MKKRVNMKSVNYFFLMQGITMNKDIIINEASGVGVLIGHTTNYLSEGEDKIIYTSCITI